MPTFLLQHTATDALSLVSGEVPLDTTMLVPAGSYRVWAVSDPADSLLTVDTGTITAKVVPAMSALYEGQAIGDVTGYATMVDAANFVSNQAGETIATVVAAATGDALTVAETLSMGDSVGFTVTVTGSLGTVALFDAGTTTVAGTAPAAIVAPAFDDVRPLADQIVTLTAGTYSGAPAPKITRGWSLGGSDVSGDVTDNGDGTYSYTIPTGTAAGTVLTVTETAANGMSPDATQTVEVTTLTIGTDPAILYGAETGYVPMPIVDPASGDVDLTVVVDGVTLYSGTLTQAQYEATSFNLVPPMISGFPATGETLTCAPGLWLIDPDAGLSSSYQWYRDGLAISGATGTTHDIVAADLGATITCRETVGTASAESNAISSGTSVSDDFSGYAPAENILESAAWELQYQRYADTFTGTGSAATLGGGLAHDVGIVRHTQTLGNDQYAQMTIVSYPAAPGSSIFGPAVRMTDGTTRGNAYVAGIVPHFGAYGEIRIERRVDETVTTISAANYVLTSPLNAGDRIRIAAQGSTITVWLDTGGGFGDPILTATDTALTGGQIGLYEYHSEAGAAVTFDNFEGGDL